MIVAEHEIDSMSQYHAIRNEPNSHAMNRRQPSLLLGVGYDSAWHF